ncbi:hypothetical protein G6F66_015174 [Rhizopus arrhizus]|nr:hypothetical protein G6F66_015174 [Rhizopus arrhizus]
MHVLDEDFRCTEAGGNASAPFQVRRGLPGQRDARREHRIVQFRALVHARAEYKVHVVTQAPLVLDEGTQVVEARILQYRKTLPGTASACAPTRQFNWLSM